MPNLRWYPPSPIDEAALSLAVGVLPRFGRFRYVVATDSTQLRAIEVLHRIDSLGISFVTESQDIGRGRAGRRWVSPSGAGLLFSTILPAELPPASLPAVGFWAALAVSEAVTRVCGITAGLKWPNDLLLPGGKKCAGILSDGRTVGASTRVVVGVGVNVNRPEDVPDFIVDGAGWLSDECGRDVDRTALLADILGAYERRFDELLEAPAEVIARWSERAALRGKRVTVRNAEGQLISDGIVKAVAPDGALLLDTAGREMTVTLGDVDVFA
jgi:BirA family biotin operon repressor/biotin-[acetyl-CoA-carboxylase] ligase